MATQVDDFLEHFGVLGMKWGVRKDPATEHIRNQRYGVVQNRQALSEKQLDSYIRRLEKERRVKDLTEDQLNPGKRIAKDIAAQSGGAVVTAVVGTAAAFGVSMLLKKFFGR